MSEENVVNYPLLSFTASLTRLVGSKVCVETVNYQKFEGIIYSIDPISGSIFLVLDSNLKLLIGTGIKHLKIIEPSHVDFASLLNQNTDTTGTDETEKIRDSLIKWFTERHIQVFPEKTNLVVLGEVTIHPPYSPENCLSHNEMMLSRIKKLLETYYEK